MSARPCLECGRPTTSGARHRECAPQRATRRERGLDEDWLRLSKQTIAEQPWCDICGATEDLTADHIVARADGGLNVRENTRTLCRPCNGREGGRLAARRHRKSSDGPGGVKSSQGP